MLGPENDSRGWSLKSVDHACRDNRYDYIEVYADPHDLTISHYCEVGCADVPIDVVIALLQGQGYRVTRDE